MTSTTTIEDEKPGHVVAHGGELAVFFDLGGKFDLLNEGARLGCA
ncbi:hypothetical protein [Rhizobium mongolense]